MKFDFTDGEWKEIVSKDGWYIKSDNHNNEDVMVCMSKIYRETLPETHKRQKADARLISCAPEMIKALIDVVKKYYDVCVEAPHIKRSKYYEDYKQNFYNDFKIQIKIIEKATGKKWSEINDNI